MSVFISTSYGNIVIDLYTEECPLASTNFLKLCKLGYYNNCVFHTIIKDFIVQSGDPTGTGSGGDSLFKLLQYPQGDNSNRFFPDELYPGSIKHDCLGTLAMANGGPNLNASQFYITLSDSHIDYLDGKHTIFGRVAEGLDYLKQINEALVDDSFRPLRPIGIKQVYILHDPFEDPPGFTNILSKGFHMQPRPPVIDDVNSTPLAERDQLSIQRHEAHSRAVVLEMIGDIPQAEIKPLENVLFVCKLNPVTEEDDLNIIFSQFGTILSLDIIRDQKTGKSLCYGFVEFETKEACESAYLKMDNARIDDRRIHVDFSQSMHKLWPRHRGHSSNKHTKGERTTKHHSSSQDHVVKRTKVEQKPYV